MNPEKPEYRPVKLSALIAEAIRKHRILEPFSEGEQVVPEINTPAFTREATLVGDLAGDWMNRPEVVGPVKAQLRRQLLDHEQIEKGHLAEMAEVQRKRTVNLAAAARVRKLLESLEAFCLEDDDDGTSKL